MMDSTLIFVALGAFLLGMLFVANLIASIFRGANRGSVVVGETRSGSSDFFNFLLLLVVLGTVWYIFTQGSMDWNEPSQVEHNDEIKSLPNEESDIYDYPNPSREGGDNPPGGIVKKSEWFAQLNSFSSYSNAEQVWLKYANEIPYELGPFIVKGDDNMFKIMAGPFQSKIEASTFAKPYKGGFPVTNMTFPIIKD